ncbi:MAG: hypothetical protein AAFV98_24545 [Chloroflexota bacterium]
MTSVAVSKNHRVAVIEKNRTLAQNLLSKFDVKVFEADIGEDGILKFEMPTTYKNTTAEVVVVLNPLPEIEATTQGYPVDFFEQIDSIDADDVVARPSQGYLDERDAIE